MSGNHRLGVSDVNLVKRHLKLIPNRVEVLQQAVDEIDKLYGLESVLYDDKAHVLHLEYDATRLSIDELEKLLKDHQIQVSNDWWTHFKKEYYRFVDENVKENKKHEPWSCHNKK